MELRCKYHVERFPVKSRERILDARRLRYVRAVRQAADGAGPFSRVLPEEVTCDIASIAWRQPP